MKLYTVTAMVDGELIGCLGAFTTLEKAEERLAWFKNDAEQYYSYGEYEGTYAEITEVEVSD